jgi:hypothetical protein
MEDKPAPKRLLEVGFECVMDVDEAKNPPQAKVGFSARVDVYICKVFNLFPLEALVRRLRCLFGLGLFA